MSGEQGIALDTWARVEGDSRISCAVDQFEAQFQGGEHESCLILVCDEGGLVRLIAEASEALQELRVKRAHRP